MAACARSDRTARRRSARSLGWDSFAVAIAIAAVPCSAQVQWKSLGRAIRVLDEHVMAYDSIRNRGLLFGGNGYAWPVYMDDLWIEERGVWKQANRVSPWPAGRLLAGAAFDESRDFFVVFGGANTTTLGDTWVFDGFRWREVVAGSGPSRRRDPAMAYDPNTNSVLLFGGEYVETNPQAVFNDTWSFDGYRWTELQPATKPPARSGARMVFDAARGKIVMTGGAWTQYYTDTWEWDGRDWNLVNNSAPARIAFLLVYDASRECVVRYGGSLGLGRVFADTWELNASNAWIQRQPVGSPPQLMWHAGYYDRLRRRTVMFGGWDGTLNGQRNELWEYSAVSTGRFDPYAVGCKGGATQWPLLRADAGDPYLSDQFVIRLESVLPRTPTTLALGNSKSSWNSIPLPLDLTGFGMPYCKLAASMEWTANGFADANGVMRWGWQVPPDTRLVGARFYSQAFALDPASHALPFVLSNACEGVIGAK